MKRIFLIRHGETAWNREGRFQGQMDIPLNDLGFRQAVAAADALKDTTVDRIVTSPLSRAVATGHPLALQKGIPIEKVDDLQEIGHGLWEGRTAGDVEKKWPGMLATWHSRPDLLNMPEGESLADVRKRAWPAFLRVTEGEGESIVVVSHDAVLKVLLCRILGCPLRSFWRFQIANGSITLLELSEKGWRMPLMGESGHLGNPFFREEQKGL